MIRVSDEATALLETIEKPAGTVLRLERSESDRLQLALGQAEPGDAVVEKGGEDILHIPAAITAMLDGLALERVDTEEGPRLTLVKAPPP